jgi:hypothetical protein
MKNKILILGIIGLFNLGCNQTTKQVEDKSLQEKLKLDSINKLQSELEVSKKKDKDSTILIEQSKVIGTISFGMQKNIVDEKIQEFRKENRRPYKIMDKTFYNDFIGEYEYFQMYGIYDDEKLYELRIKGDLTNWENYDRDVPKQLNYISNVIMQKYGEPDLSFELEERFRLQKGYTYLLRKWVVGKKIIEVRLSDTVRSYPIDVYIYLNDVREKLAKMKSENDKISTEKAKDVF